MLLAAKTVCAFLVVTRPVSPVHAFSVGRVAPPRHVGGPIHGSLPSWALAASTAESSTASVGLTNDEDTAVSRYVVQNRFIVRPGREAAFEKRWADRESRLGTLPGFRFFCMLRRLDNESFDDQTQPHNYVSCTVWETYDDFTAWRKGDAFKEAHGGGTVRGVVSMLAATARNNRGKPKPAYWQGLLPESMEGRPPADGEGWRTVTADGQSTLPTDCFVAMNRFAVLPGKEGAFETRFRQRESTLKGRRGFKGFLLLRRDGGKNPGDGQEPDDGFTHSTFSVWDTRDDFDQWMAESKQAKTKPSDGAEDGDAKPKGPPPSIYARPPSPTFYEGILALESVAGV